MRLVTAVWRKGRRGAGPMEAVLGIILFGLLLSGFVGWLDSRQRVAWEREAGREMAILAEGVEDYVRRNTARFWRGGHAGVAGAAGDRARDAEDGRVLPANFDGVDAMNRDLRVLVMPRGAGAAADGCAW